MAVRKEIRKKDGATVYSAIFTGPQGNQLVRKHRSVKKDALQKEHDRAYTSTEKFAQDSRIEIENGTWLDPKGPAEKAISFERLVAKFLKTYRPLDRETTYYQERSAVWLKYFPRKKPASGITEHAVGEFAKERGKEVGPTTVRQDLVSLSKLFRWAIARRILDRNPAHPDLVPRPSKARPDPQPWSDAEEAQLLAELGGELEPYRRVVEFAFLTGADRGEILDLRWKAVDRERTRLRLPRSKTGVDRTIPYGQSKRLSALLEAAWAQRGESDRVFVRADGKPHGMDAVKSAIRRAMDRAKITKTKPWKSFRATFATRKVEQGLDSATIAALLGLTTTQVLEHYVKPSGKYLEKAMRDPRRTVPGGRSKAAGGAGTRETS